MPGYYQDQKNTWFSTPESRQAFDKPQDPSIDPRTGKSWAPFTGLSDDAANQLANTSYNVTPTQAAYGSDVNQTDYYNATNGNVGTAPKPQDQGPPPGAPAPKPYLEDLYSQLGGAYLAPTYMSQVMPGLQDQLKGPGDMEQRYQQALHADSDPYYQRLQQQGMDALNQQMIARGHGTGAAGGAVLGNFQSGLAAQQYHQLSDMANQSQSQANARMGLSGSLANMGDKGDLARLNSLFNVAGNAQGANQNSVNSYLGQQTGIDNMGSGLVSQFYGQGGQISNQDIMAQLQGLTGSGQASAQGGQAGLQTLMSLLGLGVKAGTGGKAGG